MSGCVWVGRTVLKQWQVTDKTIEWIFFQFTFNLLQMTQTQKIIVGFPKFMNGYEGMCMSGRKFFMDWQVTDKIIESNFSNLHSTFTNDSNSKILIPRVLKNHKWMLGDEYEEREVS